ncbi:hypothetical protein H112_00619, partial [Trichophyton rubrum D6]
TSQNIPPEKIHHINSKNNQYYKEYCTRIQVDRTTDHIKADIDPEKAPETAINIREYVITTTLGNLNPPPEKDARRREAIRRMLQLSRIPTGETWDMNPSGC